MGLVLSVLVVCVGVYKFIQIYSDTGRKVSYEKNALRPTENVSKNSEPNLTTPRVQLCRDFLSHEDVEIECTSRVLSQDSTGTPSGRFLVTEKDNGRDRDSRTPSPRRFLITKEDDTNADLREFVLAKGKPKNNPDAERFVLIDTNENFRDVSPLPLPKQFVITRAAPSVNQETLLAFKQGIGIGVNSLEYMGEKISNEKLLQSSSVNTTNTKTYSVISTATKQIYHQSCNESSQIENRNGSDFQEAQISSSVLKIYNNTPEEFHRDASPYPSLEIPIRKGSISLEMLDNAKVSMDEVDEEDSVSAKVDVITKTSDFNTTEYLSNKVLVMPPADLKTSYQSPKQQTSSNATNKNLDVAVKEVRSKSASRPECSSTEELRRVNSSSKMYDKDFEEPSGLFINVMKKGEDEGFRDSLDGVKRGSEARRSFRKKKNRSQNSLGN